MKVNRSIKDFFSKLLNGVALGIIVGLIPNAILGGILKFFVDASPLIKTIYMALSYSQLATPALIGLFVAIQFKLNPIATGVTAMSSFIAAGSIVVTEGGKLGIAGIGDIINTMLIAAVSVLLLKYFDGKFGSLTIILVPLLTTSITGTLGLLTLPYVKLITGSIGKVILEFTNLQPLLMSILIAVSFAIIIVSPVSTVAIAVAIGLQGLASGAANLGIAACAMTLVVGTMQANKIGVPLTIFLGSMKIFMPNWIKYPVVNIPIITNAIFAGVLAYLFNIQGTASSAGFGFSGMVGPIAAYSFMEGSTVYKLGILCFVYFVATFVIALITDYIFVKIIKLFKRDVYIFEELNQ